MPPFDRIDRIMGIVLSSCYSAKYLLPWTMMTRGLFSHGNPGPWDYVKDSWLSWLIIFREYWSIGKKSLFLVQTMLGSNELDI